MRTHCKSASPQRRRFVVESACRVAHDRHTPLCGGGRHKWGGKKSFFLFLVAGVPAGAGVPPPNPPPPPPPGTAAKKDLPPPGTPRVAVAPPGGPRHIFRVKETIPVQAGS